MNIKAPKILNDIVAALKISGLTAVTEDTEGRVNSKKDEDKIIDWLLLQPQFKDKIRQSKIRSMADIWVSNDGVVWDAINIKTSIGSSDNAFSKLGILWSLTDMTTEEFLSLKIDKKISDNQFTELVLSRKAETPRDYWYLTLDKSNFSNVMVRGMKQIVHWSCNPTNNLQILWNKEHCVPPGTENFESVYYNIVTDGVFRCWDVKSRQWTEAIDFRSNNLRK